MAGAGLIAIRRRIKSVTNTRKITKAMGLVATAKLRKAKEALVLNEKYFNSIDSVKDKFLNSMENIDSSFAFKNHSSKKLFIVLTSEAGLCGSFNASVMSTAIGVIKKDPENSIIMVVGEKGRVYFNKTNYETVAEYVGVPDLPTTKEAKTIYNHGIDLFRKGEIGEINIVYTKFISPVKQTVVVEQVLPITFSEANENTDNIIFEPSKKEVVDSIIERYLKAKIFNCLIHSKVSEHGTRMSAMDGATKNANELLDKLKLKYNRIRQSAITQEISEIVGGAEAQR